MFPYHQNASNGFQQIQESRIQYNKGKLKYNKEEYSESLEFFQVAVKMQEFLFGKYHTETIKSYFWMGKASCKVGQLNLALKAFQRATRMAESVFDKPDYNTLLSNVEQCWYVIKPSNDMTLGTMMKIFNHEQIGDTATREGRFVEAIENYCEALSLQDSLLGSDSLDGADIRYKLGCSLLQTQSAPQAQKTLQLAYDCFVKEVGTDHPASLGAAAKIRTIAAT
jgi:tetratricopeptide (TPR) repeat protein